MRRLRIRGIDEERARALLIIQGIRNLRLLGENRGIGIGRIRALLPSLRKTPNQGGMVGVAGEDDAGRSLPRGQRLK